jgi:hypothetical protein
MTRGAWSHQTDSLLSASLKKVLSNILPMGGRNIGSKTNYIWSERLVAELAFDFVSDVVFGSEFVSGVCLVCVACCVLRCVCRVCSVLCVVCCVLRVCCVVRVVYCVVCVVWCVVCDV